MQGFPVRCKNISELNDVAHLLSDLAVTMHEAFLLKSLLTKSVLSRGGCCEQEKNCFLPKILAAVVQTGIMDLFLE